MTYRGHVKSGQIILDEQVALPEGSEVQVELVEERPISLIELLLKHAGKGGDMPADLAANHDHYIHGTLIREK